MVPLHNLNANIINYALNVFEDNFEKHLLTQKNYIQTKLILPNIFKKNDII